MPRPKRHDHPAMLWYEARDAKQNCLHGNPLYQRHDAHVKEYRSNPLGWVLRRYQSKHDHKSHVHLFNRHMKAGLARHGTWQLRHDHDDSCMLWSGSKGSVNAPLFKLSGNAFNAITQYHRLYMGTYLQPGHVWAPATCSNPNCIRHRVQQERSLFMAERNRQVAQGKAFMASVTRANRKRSPYTQEQIARMHELKAEGLSARMIAAEVGAKRASVAHILRGTRWGGVKHRPSGITFITSQLLGAQA